MSNNTNVVSFPRTSEMMNRDMDKIVDQSIDILERSEALLRWAEYVNNEGNDIEVPCKEHPDAPHGFDRTSSHSLGRYVCECEGWIEE